MTKALFEAAVAFNRHPSMDSHVLFRYWRARSVGTRAEDALYSAQNVAREVGIQTYADNHWLWDTLDAQRIAGTCRRKAMEFKRLP